MESVTDEQLVGEYLQGNEAALTELLERYLKPIYNFVYRYVGSTGDAEDLTQDTFLRAWKHLKRFDPKRRFKTWLFAIAKNASLNWIAKKKPLLLSTFEDAEGENPFADSLTDPGPLPEEIFERKDLGRALTSAMELLGPDQRTVLYLRYNDHFTLQEIADSLGKPLDTIKSQHRRGLLKLRKLLTR